MAARLFSPLCSTGTAAALEARLARAEVELLERLRRRKEGSARDLHEVGEAGGAGGSSAVGSGAADLSRVPRLASSDSSGSEVEDEVDVDYEDDGDYGDDAYDDYADAMSAGVMGDAGPSSGLVDGLVEEDGVSLVTHELLAQVGIRGRGSGLSLGDLVGDLASFSTSGGSAPRFAPVRSQPRPAITRPPESPLDAQERAERSARSDFARCLIASMLEPGGLPTQPTRPDSPRSR